MCTDVGQETSSYRCSNISTAQMLVKLVAIMGTRHFDVQYYLKDLFCFHLFASILNPYKFIYLYTLPVIPSEWDLLSVRFHINVSKSSYSLIFYHTLTFAHRPATFIHPK